MGNSSVFRKEDNKLIDNKYKVKYIYKIECILNNKVYIGQSFEPNKRIKQHFYPCMSKSSGNELYKDIAKFGKNGFTSEIIESVENELSNEREIYWVNIYRKSNRSYNLYSGGNVPPILKGSNSIHAKLTIDQVEAISELIRNNVSTKDITVKYKINKSTVDRINSGEIWYRDCISYPILNKEIDYLGVIKALREDSNLTQKDIAIKFGIKRSTVTMINIGKNHPQEHLSYPIRPKKTGNK